MPASYQPNALTDLFRRVVLEYQLLKLGVITQTFAIDFADTELYAFGFLLLL